MRWDLDHLKILAACRLITSFSYTALVVSILGESLYRLPPT
jgi:hypothetical protein